MKKVLILTIYGSMLCAAEQRQSEQDASNHWLESATRTMRPVVAGCAASGATYWVLNNLGRGFIQEMRSTNYLTAAVVGISMMAMTSGYGASSNNPSRSGPVTKEHVSLAAASVVDGSSPSEKYKDPPPAQKVKQAAPQSNSFFAGSQNARAQVDVLTKGYDDRARDIECIYERKEHYKGIAKRLESELAAARAKITEGEQEIRGLTQKLHDLERELVRVEGISRERDFATKLNEEFKAKVVDLERRLASLDESNVQQREKIAILETEKKNYESQISELKADDVRSERGSVRSMRSARSVRSVAGGLHAHTSDLYIIKGEQVLDPRKKAFLAQQAQEYDKKNQSAVEGADATARKKPAFDE